MRGPGFDGRSARVQSASTVTAEDLSLLQDGVLYCRGRSARGPSASTVTAVLRLVVCISGVGLPRVLSPPEARFLGFLRFFADFCFRLKKSGATSRTSPRPLSRIDIVFRKRRFSHLGEVFAVAVLVVLCCVRECCDRAASGGRSARRLLPASTVTAGDLCVSSAVVRVLRPPVPRCFDEHCDRLALSSLSFRSASTVTAESSPPSRFALLCTLSILWRKV